MTMNPLPPQAYTKETMLRAYQWLQAQPSSIRELAMTPDILVSLYLKASREGEQALERPSIQNFKTELKNLAGLMGEFESPAVSTPAGSHGPAPRAQVPTSNYDQAPVPPAPPKKMAPPPPPTSPTPVAPQPTLPQNAALPSVDFLTLDSKTLEMLRETKEDYNLSSEGEALRMLIKIGFSKAKSLLKN